MNDAGTRTQGLTSRLGAQTVAAGSHCESGNCPDHTGRALSQSVQDAGGTEFGRLLAGFRSSYGLSQEELAERSGMSASGISNG
jgi:hypothetical protein